MRIFTFGQTMAPFFSGTGPDFPAHDLESLDDEQVKGCMLSCGCTELLQDSPPKWGQHGAGTADIRMYIHREHPTHWFIFLRWEHSANPSDNGYGLFGWQKATHSSEDFMKQIHEACSSFKGGLPITYGERPTKREGEN